MSEQAIKRAQEVFREHGGVMSTKDILQSGIHRRTLYAMRDAGRLETISRGRYRLDYLHYQIPTLLPSLSGCQGE